MPDTHEVLNQVPPLVNYNLAEDPALLEGLHREGAGWAEAELRELGQLAGSQQAQDWGRQANENPPVLKTHDRHGHRIDEVDFHPAWHELMNVAVSQGLHAAPWTDQRPAAHAARAAKFLVWSQVEAGHMCPISMTYAAVSPLRYAPELSAIFEPLLAAPHYDFGLREPSTKRGVIAGMSMTEKQGGSDVRANTTTAEPSADGSYLITGHKWFTSAPMSDIFLTLAQAPGGLTCFLLPRILPDGSRNPIRLQRLKDKLGNRSNASAEIEYDAALGWRVGEEGRGVPTIVEMVNNTRLDCVLATTALMRQATVQAVHHCTYREAFGTQLIDQPAMANVLADLVLESEAATTLALRLAGARGEEDQGAFRRLALAAAKYWVCKRGPVHAGEALECLGGNGYVEESGMPRIYREAPLLSIWEGTGNVAALDTLRAMTKEPETVEAFFQEVGRAAGQNRHLDAALKRLQQDLPAVADPQYQVRRTVEQMALVLQGSLLVRHSPPAVADAFCASRLGGDWGHAFGTLPASVDTDTILSRARLP